MARKEPETLCIVKGQLAITLLFLRQLEGSVRNFVVVE